MNKTGYVFISYARKDGSNYAVQLDDTLCERGFRTWRDKRSLDPTQDFTAELERAIESAAYVVVCITPDVRRDDSFARREIGYALVVKKPVLVARFDDVPPPISIVNHTWIDFFIDWQQSFRHLCDLLGQTRRDYPSGGKADPYKAYLEALYKQIVQYLNKTVFSVLPGHTNTSLLSLHAKGTPDAAKTSGVVEVPVLSPAFFDMAGITDLPEQEEFSFSSLHEAFQKYGGRILLLGEPGTGKTTTLMAFARDMIAKRLEDPNQPLPIIIPVATWDAEKRSPLAEWLAEAVPLLKESLDHIIKNRRALFILDGLDELGAVREDSKTREKYDPRLRFLEVMPTSSQVVISCRVKEYHDIGAKMAVNGAVTLQPLDDLQLKQYLQNLPYLWDMLQEDDNLRQVARTPLLLSLFGYAFAGLAEEAKQLQYSGRGELRDKIFEVYVARRYQHEARKPHSRVRFSLEEIYSILGSVSLYQCSYGDVRGARVDNWLEDERVLQFEALVEELHIVREHENHKPRFMHLLLRDYFAYPRAVKLLQRQALDGDTITAIRALGNIGDERAIELLIEKEDVTDEYARGEQIGWLASDAIALIKGKS